MPGVKKKKNHNCTSIFFAVLIQIQKIILATNSYWDSSIKGSFNFA